MTLFNSGFLSHVVSRLDSEQVQQGIVISVPSESIATYKVKVAGLGRAAYTLEGVQHNPVFTVSLIHI